MSIAAIVALVLVGTAIAGAWVWYGWGTTQPEKVLPGSSIGFARLDLSPGLGQRLKIDNLAEKFPKNQKSTQEFVEQLKRDMVKELDLDPLDYDTDVKPWFADRIGFAAWAKEGTKDLCGLIALASKDDGKAATALTKVRDDKGADDFGFAFNGGYAVLATCGSSIDSQGAAEAAVAAAKSESLAQHKSFADAVREMPSGQTALGWVDLSALPELLPQQGADPIVSSAAGLKGQLVVGAQATDNGVDLRYRLSGSGATATGKDVLAELGEMPGNTAVGAAADLSAAGTRLDELKNQIDRELPNAEEETGVPAATLRDGIRAVLGSVLTLAVTDVSGDEPVLQLAAKAANADAARAIRTMLEQFGARPGQLPPGVDIKSSGDRVTVTVGDFREADGRLVDNSLYGEAMEGATGTSVAAVFVDVQKIASAENMGSEQAANVKPIKAVGFTTGYDGDTLVGLLRVVIK